GQAEERRRERIPQQLHDFTADEDEYSHTHQRGRRNESPVFSFHVRSSRFCQLVIDALQSPSQTQYGVSFSGEQRLDADVRLAGDLFETAAFQLVCDKDITLFFWQFVDRQLEFLE